MRHNNFFLVFVLIVAPQKLLAPPTELLEPAPLPAPIHIMPPPCVPVGKTNVIVNQQTQEKKQLENAKALIKKSEQDDLEGTIKILKKENKKLTNEIKIITLESEQLEDQIVTLQHHAQELQEKLTQSNNDLEKSYHTLTLQKNSYKSCKRLLKQHEQTIIQLKKQLMQTLNENHHLKQNYEKFLEQQMLPIQRDTPFGQQPIIEY